MTVAAIIPARGGSKRLPRKNILTVSGRPMLAWPIERARESSCFDRIIVSTEDDEIADCAINCGAEVVRRPHSLSQDHSTVVDVCLHVLGGSPEISTICCIYATAFLVTSSSIASSRELLNNPAVDFVMGVSEYDYPPVQALQTDHDGYLSYMWPEWKGVRSQNQPKLVVSNGTFYWARAAALKEEKTFYGRRLKGFSMPEKEVSDIDTMEDLERALRRFAER